jgi:nucleoside-diphosphate-sugar epimerase
MTLSGKTALVTGAAGFLSSALTLRLASEGVKVRALVRRPEKAKFLHDQPNIDIVQGDITDAARMREVTQGCDYVFHVAVLYGSHAEQQRVNVEGTRNVVQAAEAANITRLIHVSTLAVYGYVVPSEVPETTPLAVNHHDPYVVSKGQAESIVRAAKIPYSIIRPGGIYGARSGLWTRTMFSVARRNPTIFVGDGSGTPPIIYVDDVVNLLLTVAEHPKAVGEAFNCATDPSPTWREFLGAYSKLAGHNNWLGIPVPIAMGAVSLASAFASSTSAQRDLPKLVRYGTHRVRYPMTKARELLGWQPKIDLATGVKLCEPWLREKGLLV